MSKRKQPKQTPLYDAIAEADKLTCGVCGYTDELDAFDVILADDGYVFCGGCSNEISAETGEVNNAQLPDDTG